MKHAFDFVENLESNFCRAFKMTFRYIGICTSEQAHAVYVHTPHTNICTCAIHANFGKWTQVEQSTKWYWTRHFLDDLIDTKPKATTDWREFEKKKRSLATAHGGARRCYHLFFMLAFSFLLYFFWLFLLSAVLPHDGVLYSFVYYVCRCCCCCHRRCCCY